jgi:adenylate kinase family enzyme
VKREGLLQRIAVVGTSGSGKTTMARRVAQQLGVPHIELDALYWGPDWTPSTREAFRERVARALDGETWTTDGNYSAARDIIWGRADTVVWLDYAWPIVMGRVTWRTIWRSVTGEELWHGNRERLREAFAGKDSIIWWALRTYRRRKREYPALFGQAEYAHLTVVHLRSPRSADEWLESIPGANGA